MFLSNPAKIFLTGFILLGFLSGSGCRRTAENSTLAPAVDVPELPFPSKEPETFQAEITVSAGGVETKTFVARNGERRRTDYDFGGNDQLTILETDKRYLLSFRNKVYSEEESSAAGVENSDDPLTPILAARENMDIEKLGVEYELTKYRASPRDNDSSEVIIYVDESLGLPVRQEFFSINGDQRTLEYSAKLTNFRREIDTGVFEIPPDFRQTSIEAFRKLTARR